LVVAGIGRRCLLYRELRRLEVDRNELPQVLRNRIERCAANDVYWLPHVTIFPLILLCMAPGECVKFPVRSSAVAVVSVFGITAGV
jgi:hypothetical protein